MFSLNYSYSMYFRVNYVPTQVRFGSGVVMNSPLSDVVRAKEASFKSWI